MSSKWNTSLITLRASTIITRNECFRPTCTMIIDDICGTIPKLKLFHWIRYLNYEKWYNTSRRDLYYRTSTLFRLMWTRSTCHWSAVSVIAQFLLVGYVFIEIKLVIFFFFSIQHSANGDTLILPSIVSRAAGESVQPPKRTDEDPSWGGEFWKLHSSWFGSHWKNRCRYWTLLSTLIFWIFFHYYKSSLWGK